MLRLSKLVLLAGIAIISLFSLAQFTPVEATSATGSQNPNLTVFVSLSPDRATVGDTITVTQSVTNNSSAALTVTLTDTLKVPSGHSYTASRTVTLTPGTHSKTFSYAVQPYFPKGDYYLTLTATNQGSSSSATAEVTIF